MSNVNPYESPQESPTAGASEGVVNWLALAAALVLQLALMVWFAWENTNGGMEGMWLFMAIGVGILGCFLGLLITAIVLRSWNLVIVQVIVFVIDALIFLLLM